ncbi:hypothetical protein FNF28_03865 [Cafeteria roenbergensis]|uniref:Activator of Hsp90 ATPase AHSA1-like N-terminal domain-containing protein n=1 Tax=Cafeteria roenbergensis TaxID=33653 RepID=A0A5A8DIR6_CAFRO|nr:hypothetical protein FNF28_03865 [Cafeteria roenbergensis]
MAEGAGSVWNPGSWHWESKTYTQAMKGMVADGLAAVAVSHDGIDARVTKVKSVTGDAEINIRKGKKLAVFEVAAKAEYEAWTGEALEKGTLEIVEVYQDDMDEDFDVRFAVTHPADGLNTRALRVGPLAEAVRAVIRHFANKLPDMDGGEAALAEAKERRAAERAIAEAAEAAARARAAEVARLQKLEADALAETVAHRMALAEAKKTKEAEDAAPEVAASAARAAGLAADASAAASAATGAGAAAEAAPEGASVWNKGGYHWEERDLTVWAKERLTALLMDVEIDVPGGLLTIVEVKEIKGDASSSMRKGAHIVFYEFKMKLAWEGEIVDGEGGVKATGDGEVEIEKFDQEDDLDHVKITVKAASDKRADAGLGRQMKMIGEPLIREALKTFVGELRVR